MIDLPVGKALVAVYADIQCKQKCTDPDYQCSVDDCCYGCEISTEDIANFSDSETCGFLACIPKNRRDKKHVIYKLVDYPV